MYQQVLKPVGDSYALTSIFAALPILTLFVLLGVLKVRAWVAAMTALVVAVAVSIVVYSMPVGQTLLSASEGGTFGFFPILWIVINAIWIYNLTVETGHFDVLRRSFEGVSPDMRVQAVIIAFCFGALLEALAGFGTPVAISAVMLIALGFPPLKAATVALIANTAPVAFGALAIPIVTLADRHRSSRCSCRSCSSPSSTVAEDCARRGSPRSWQGECSGWFSSSLPTTSR